MLPAKDREQLLLVEVVFVDGREIDVGQVLRVREKEAARDCQCVCIG